jgi:hypothetical protein
LKSWSLGFLRPSTICHLGILPIFIFISKYMYIHTQRCCINCTLIIVTSSITLSYPTAGSHSILAAFIC